jgi:hypothetical protein
MTDIVDPNEGSVDVEQMTTARKNEQIVKTYKQLYIKRYGLEGINIEEEAKKVLNKTSSLSRSKRDAVLAFMEIFPTMQNHLKRQNEIEDLPVGTPLTKEEADAAIEEASKNVE